jgi:hypothetical protein
MSQGSSALRIRIVTRARVAAVHAVHVANLGPHLFPRTIDEFERIADEQAMFELVDAAADASAPPVGVCYVRPSPDDEHEFEFGGVYLHPDLRGRRLLDELGRVAIATQFVVTAPRRDDKLIAHVHVDNRLPRSLLVRLGFVDKKHPISIPGEHAPANMQRGEDGNVWGDTFEFDFAQLATLASEIERGLDAPSRIIEVEVPAFSPMDRAESFEALRAIANGYRARD